jgi:hypothetical protein
VTPSLHINLACLAKLWLAQTFLSALLWTRRTPADCCDLSTPEFLHIWLICTVRCGLRGLEWWIPSIASDHAIGT